MGEADELARIQNRIKVLHRARSTLRRLINANAWQWPDSRGSPVPPKFLTLTHAANITDIKYSNSEFTKFIKRLKRHTNTDIKYIAVIEFQKRGSIHYHIVIFNLPYTRKEEIARIWRHGYVKINAIDNIYNIGAYVSKYMGKDVGDDRLVGEKCYFTSRGLKKPVEIKDSAQIWGCLDAIKEKNMKVYGTTFTSDYTGVTEYTQYMLVEEWARAAGLEVAAAREMLASGEASKEAAQGRQGQPDELEEWAEVKAPGWTPALMAN